MKKAVLCLCALAAALALIPPAPAGCRRVAARHQAAVAVQTPVVATVVAPVVATTFLAVPVPVYPVYGVGYGQGDTAAEVRALTAELARLRAVLAPAAKPTPPAAMPRADADVTPNVTSAPKVVAASCLRCHGVTNPKGGVSLAGDVPLMVRLQAFRAAATGKMPPTPAAPIADADLEALAKWSE